MICCMLQARANEHLHPEALSPLSTNYPINELLLRSSWTGQTRQTFFADGTDGIDRIDWIDSFFPGETNEINEMNEIGVVVYALWLFSSRSP